MLQQAEQIINGEYLTADGNKLTGVAMFKAWGIPVISSNNLPSTVITGHPLSNANNGNAYDVSAAEAKCKAVIMHPRSLLAAESIPLTSDVWYDKGTFQWYIDSYLAYGVTVNRPDLCGAVFSF